MTPEPEQEGLEQAPEGENPEQAPEQEAAEEALPPEPAAAPAPALIVKPRNNIYTLLLLISLLFIMVSIYLIGWELRNYYGATFGVLSPLESTEKRSGSTVPSTPTTPSAPSEPISPTGK